MTFHGQNVLDTPRGVGISGERKEPGIWQQSRQLLEQLAPPGHAVACESHSCMHMEGFASSFAWLAVKCVLKPHGPVHPPARILAPNKDRL